MNIRIQVQRSVRKPRQHHLDTRTPAGTLLPW
jgi:hypothetical protein